MKVRVRSEPYDGSVRSIKFVVESSTIGLFWKYHAAFYGEEKGRPAAIEYAQALANPEIIKVVK